MRPAKGSGTRSLRRPRPRCGPGLLVPGPGSGDIWHARLDTESSLLITRSRSHASGKTSGSMRRAFVGRSGECSRSSGVLLETVRHSALGLYRHDPSLLQPLRNETPSVPRTDVEPLLEHRRTEEFIV